jgi:ABC-type amino acid transport substrate-binding protein
VKFRGRKFLSGLSSADVNNSVVTPAAQGRLQILADQFTIPLGSDPTEFLPVLYHKDNNTFTFIDKAIARLVVRNMRSRQVGIGV